MERNERKKVMPVNMINPVLIAAKYFVAPSIPSNTSSFFAIALAAIIPNNKRKILIGSESNDLSLECGLAENGRSGTCLGQLYHLFRCYPSG